MRSGAAVGSRGTAVDDRTTLVLLVVCLLAVGLARTPTALALAYLLIAVLGWYRGVGLSRTARRVWLGLPLVTALLLLPATLALVTPGPTAALLPGGIAVSTTGIRATALMVTRTACSLSLVLTVTSSMPWPRLLTALCGLRLPRTLTAVVAMAHRYVIVLTTVLLDSVDAHRARTVDWQRLGRRSIAGHLGGAVLGRSLQLSEEVHDAMRARGFTGRVAGPERRRLTRADAAACLITLAAVGTCAVVDIEAGGWAV